ncbi:MAG: DnaA/Hda family protein, partial [Phycisphaeraceae bacterium]|nr:DnaA/Hda family protein [Phycisphaeraceae bacterium]
QPAGDGVGGRLEVAVPNQFVADWIKRNFKADLKSIASEATGGDVELTLTVTDAEPETPPAAAPADASPAPGNNGSSDAPAAVSRTTSRSTLRHELDSFVVGPSNQLAYAAVTRLVDGRTDYHSPLFLHGGCGLGKTHLLQGLCRRVLDQRNGARVLYMTGEAFTNAFLQAMRANAVDRFRARIRKLDLLAVDDVHFIAGKNATRQEFLHSFDAIDLGGARVALASDSHPRDIQQLGESLVSRCLRGMVVQVHEPDPETRRRVVAALAERRGLSLRDGVADRIAAAGGEVSVREIEGTLTRLQAISELEGGGESSIGHSILAKALGSTVEPTRRGPVGFEAIFDTVVDRLGVTRTQLTGNGRQRQVVLARSLVAHLSRRLTAMSFPEIARAMGRPTHSTIIAADQRIQEKLSDGEQVTLPRGDRPVALADLVEELVAAIESRDR